MLPNGSATTATRPTGMSKGPVTTRPPAACTAAAALSAEVTSQFGSYFCPVVRTISVSLPGMADLIVAPPQLLAKPIAIETQARVEVWHRDLDRI